MTMNPFPTHQGEVHASFRSTDQEILMDLLAVIQAINLKPVRLTKSGIPPKPLWTAINKRLVWSDPQSILYDWEEIDQVRFIYRLAEGLGLIRIDEERLLQTSPGADQFFLATPLERAALIKRAYFNLWDWDERCDARNGQGHRYNFGQAFRRDFLYDVTTLREESWRLMQWIPKDEWVQTADLARVLTEQLPDLLLSEQCDPPETTEEGYDLEKIRFANFWLSMMSRFGWAHLARLPSAEIDGRLCQLSDLGWALVHGGEVPEQTATKAISLDKRMTPALDAEQASATDQYVVLRLLQPEVTSDEPPPTRLTSALIRRGLEVGVDLDSLITYLEEHLTTPLPTTLTSWREEALSGRLDLRIVENAVLVESDDQLALQTDDQRTYILRPHSALAAGVDVPFLFEFLGGEPEEGYDYPGEDPVATWKNGPTLQFLYEALPISHRDLALQLGAEGAPPRVTFTRTKLQDVLQSAWSLESLLDATRVWTHRSIPPKIRAQLLKLLE